jgi:Helix-turn-helix domain
MISEFVLHSAMVAAKVPVTPRHVLRVLRMREMMNPNGEAAWPSYQRIADDVGMSRRSIIEAVKWCAENGWLGVVKRGSDHGDSETNEYRIRIPVGGGAAIALPSEGEFEAEGGSAVISLGVVQQFHQGGEMAAPKEGMEEGRSNEENTTHSFAIAHESSAVGKSDAPTMIDESDLGINVHCLDYCVTHGVSEPRDRWDEFCSAVLFQREDICDEPYGVAASNAFRSWIRGRREWARRSKPWMYSQQQAQTVAA